MKKNIIITTLFFLVLAACFSYFIFFPRLQKSSIAKVDYTLWAEVLQNFVNDEGLVDYASLKARRGILDDFIMHIQKVDVSALSLIEQKAFWINAYNALTLDVVARAYPIETIRKIDLGLVWEKPRSVAGMALSLGHIEHKILRPLGDPRIHFAINCASIGCPDLSRKPFYPSSLDSQLEEATVAFINNPEKVRLDRNQNVLYYSEIFNWFKKDFLLVADSIKEYIVTYINQEDADYISDYDVSVDKISYDWDLNEQK